MASEGVSAHIESWDLQTCTNSIMLQYILKHFSALQKQLYLHFNKLAVSVRLNHNETLFTILSVLFFLRKIKHSGIDSRFMSESEDEYIDLSITSFESKVVQDLPRLLLDTRSFPLGTFLEAWDSHPFFEKGVRSVDLELTRWQIHPSILDEEPLSKTRRTEHEIQTSIPVLYTTWI